MLLYSTFYCVKKGQYNGNRNQGLENQVVKSTCRKWITNLWLPFLKTGLALACIYMFYFIYKRVRSKLNRLIYFSPSKINWTARITNSFQSLVAPPLCSRI